MADMTTDHHLSMDDLAAAAVRKMTAELFGMTADPDRGTRGGTSERIKNFHGILRLVGAILEDALAAGDRDWVLAGADDMEPYDGPFTFRFVATVFRREDPGFIDEVLQEMQRRPRLARVA